MEKKEEKIVYAITEELIQSLSIDEVGRELTVDEIDIVVSELFGTSEIIYCVHDAISYAVNGESQTEKSIDEDMSLSISSEDF